MSKGITEFVITNSGGLVKDKKQANLVMIVVIVVSVLIMFLLMGGEKEQFIQDGLKPLDPSSFETV